MMSESETGLLAAAGRRHERSGRSDTLRSPVSGIFLDAMEDECLGRREDAEKMRKVLDTNMHLQMP
jgi:hypothetical protein